MKKLENILVLIGLTILIWGILSWLEIAIHSLDTNYIYSNWNMIIWMLKVIPVLTK